MASPRGPDQHAATSEKQEAAPAAGRVAPGSAEGLCSYLAQAAGKGIAVISSAPGAWSVSRSPVLLPSRLKGREVVLLDLSHLTAVLEHNREDQVIGIEAGMTARELDRMLAASGQWWPVSWPDDRATVSEIIAAGDGGCLEHGFGGPRELTLGLSAALSGGELVSGGGKVVKNVSGFDLPKLFIGSRGWIGVVVTAHLRLFARPPCFGAVVVLATTAGGAFEIAFRLNSSAVALSCLEVVDRRLLDLVLAGEGEAALTGLAGRFAVPASEAPFAVLIQGYGQPDVVAATMEAVEKRISVPAGRQVAVSDEECSILLRRLADPAYACGLSQIELACPPAAMPALADWCRAQAGSPPWQARPSRGRLKLYAPDAGSAAAIQKALEGRAAERAEPVVVACGDEDYAWRVRTLPAAGDHALSLKAEIKRRYDPAGSLNPHVKP